MGWLNSIKTWLYKRSLAAFLGARSKKNTNLEKAKSVGILFDANNLETRKIVLKYISTLKKAGKKVSALGFMDIADENAQFDFLFYSNKNIDWANRPKGEQIDAFTAKSFDVFIHLNTSSSLVTDFIAIKTQAGLKIGPATENLAAYDIMIDMNDEQPLTKFISAYETILQKTNIHAKPVEV